MRLSPCPRLRRDYGERTCAVKGQGCGLGGAVGVFHHRLEFHHTVVGDQWVLLPDEDMQT